MGWWIPDTYANKEILHPNSSEFKYKSTLRTDI